MEQDALSLNAFCVEGFCSTSGFLAFDSFNAPL